MARLGMRFIGVVKTATNKYPQAYLSSLSMNGRGEWKGVTTIINGTSLYAFVWVDRNRRYFITNTSSLCHGRHYVRRRLRQVEAVSTNEEPVQQTFTINQPKASELYYDVCGKIDHHNRRRHDTLRLERKVEVKDWSKRVNLSILGMIIVDSFLLYHHLVNKEETEPDFYNLLAEELIDNTYDSVSPRRRRAEVVQASPEAVGPDGNLRSGCGVHLTPTKRKRKNTNHRLQGDCKVCGIKTSHSCSDCKTGRGSEMWLCHSTTWRDCFAKHITAKHST
mgnify:CR=1 FL=1